MKKRIAVGLVLFLGSVGYVCGQQYKIDSLTLLLPKTAGKERVDILNRLAFAHAVALSPEAEKVANEAVQRARTIEYSVGLAEAFKNLSLVYQGRSEYALAMDYSYQSLKLYESLDDKRGQSRVLNNLALVLLEQKEYERSRDFSLRSLRLKRECGDSLGVANSILALAEYYRLVGKFPEALELSQSALDRYKGLHNDWGICYAFYHIGEIYQDEKKYPMASAYYYDAMRMGRFMNDHQQIINVHKRMGQLFLASQKFDSAYTYFHKTLRLARQHNNRNNEMQVHQFLADYYVAIGNLDSALYYTRTAATIEREIFTNQRREQVATMQMLYDFEKNEHELAFQKKQIRRQYVAITGVTLILALSVIFGYKLYMLNRNNRKAKDDLIKLNAEINAMNENLEQIVQQRTEELKHQHEKLVGYAFFTAHEVRGPLARILGLIELAKLKDLNLEDRAQIMTRLETAANELDEVIRITNRKLENNRPL